MMAKTFKILNREINAPNAWKITAGQYEELTFETEISDLVFVQDIFDLFLTMFECHPSEDNTYLVIFDKRKDSALPFDYNFFFVCEHFEESDNLTGLAYILEKMKINFVEDYTTDISINLLDGNWEKLIIEGYGFNSKIVNELSNLGLQKFAMKETSPKSD